MHTKKAWAPEISDTEVLQSIRRAARALKGTEELTEQNVARRASAYPKSRGYKWTLQFIQAMNETQRADLGVGIPEQVRPTERVRPKVGHAIRYFRSGAVRRV